MNNKKMLSHYLSDCEKVMVYKKSFPIGTPDDWEVYKLNKKINKVFENETILQVFNLEDAIIFTLKGSEGDLGWIMFNKIGGNDHDY